jgi:hypothetical protein
MNSEDEKIIELNNAGFSTREIISNLGLRLEEPTINKRISGLRRILGKEKVKYRGKRKKGVNQIS